MWAFRSIETLIQDVQYGVRMLLKNPGFTAVAMLTLALGIGANSAIFSLLDEVLLRPLPVERPEQLVTLKVRSEGLDSAFSYPDYVYLRDHNDVFSSLIGYAQIQLNLGTNGQAERTAAMLVTGNYFSVLGVEAALGRTFLPEEGQTPNRNPVVVISYGAWQRRFGADPALLGKTINLNGHPFTVIGVTPAEFTSTSRGYAPEVYVPAMMFEQVQPSWTSDWLTSRDYSFLWLMGRLKPGVRREQTVAALTMLHQQIISAAQSDRKGADNRIMLEDGRRGDASAIDNFSTPLKLLMAIIGLVLLVACANVANLLLARASARSKEMAIRLAIGAGRGRLIRQLLTESLLLSLLAGVVGLGLARWVTDVLVAFTPPNANLTLKAELNLRVLGFTLLLSLLTSLVFGLAPAINASKPDLVSALKDESGGGWNTRRFSFKNLLVVGQVALSLVVLISAGLCIKSLKKLQAVDAGFDVAKVLVMSVDPGLSGYDEARGRAFYSQLTKRISALPTIESVSVASVVPLSAFRMFWLVKRIESAEVRSGESLNLLVNIVGENYFKTLGTPLLAGRDFGPPDSEAAPKVAIINEVMAKKYWPDGHPLGKHIYFSGSSSASPGLEIVGVVKASKYSTLTEEPEPAFYMPLQQSYSPNLALHIRTAGNSAALIAAARHEVQALDPNLPVYNIKTLTEQRSQSLYTERMTTILLTAFGLLALLLTAVGIYGVLAYSVNRRTREIGIRLALGAQRHDILKLVVKQGMILALIGVVVGLAAAFALTRLMSSLLYGVSATDPLTFAGIALLLTLVALLACYLPARRAMKVDPMVALRYE